MRSRHIFLKSITRRHYRKGVYVKGRKERWKEFVIPVHRPNLLKLKNK